MTYLDDLRSLADSGYLPGWRYPAVRYAVTLIEAIDALHQPLTDSEWLVKRCTQCDIEWPCPTHLLIHPEDDAPYVS